MRTYEKFIIEKEFSPRGEGLRAKMRAQKEGKSSSQHAAEVAKNMMIQNEPKQQVTTELKYKTPKELEKAQKRNQKADKKTAKKKAKKEVRKQLLDIKQSNSDAYVRNSYKNEEVMTYKTFDDWLQEATTGDLRQMGATPAQIAKLKQRREKRGFGFDRGDDRAGKKTPTSKPKALPAAADKGSAIVRAKNRDTKTGKEAIGAPRVSGPGVKSPGSKTYSSVSKPKPKPYSTDGAKPVDRKPIDKSSALSTKVKPDKPKRKSVFRDAIKQGATGGLMGGSENDRREAKRKLGNKIGTGIRNAPGKALGAAGKAVGSVANSARGTIQDKGEKMQDAKVTPVKRGIYNP